MIPKIQYHKIFFNLSVSAHYFCQTVQTGQTTETKHFIVSTDTSLWYFVQTSQTTETTLPQSVDTSLLSVPAFHFCQTVQTGQTTEITLHSWHRYFIMAILQTSQTGQTTETTLPNAVDISLRNFDQTGHAAETQSQQRFYSN